MTPKELEIALLARYKFDRYWNYATSVLIIIAMPTLAIILETNQVFNRQPNHRILFYTFSLIFIGLGIYGLLLRIKINYTLHKIETKLSTNKNIELIKELPKKLKLEKIEEKNTFFKYILSVRYWDKLPVYLLAENNYIYVNVQSKDYGYDGGFIDFGRSKRGLKRIIREIKKYQQPT